MPEGIQGLPLKEILLRFLDAWNHKGSDWMISEIMDRSPGIHGAQETLRRHGFMVREVQPSIAELNFLGLPALMRQGGDIWYVLLERGRYETRVLDSEGERTVPIDALAATFEGPALEITEAMPWRKKVLRLIGPVLLREKGVLVQVALASLGLQLLALAMPQFTRIAMDRAIPEGAGALLQLVVLGLVLTALGRAWVGWLREQAVLFLESRLETIISRGYLSHLLSLPFPFLNKKTLGDLLQAQAGLGAARDLLTEHLVGAVLDGALALLYLVAMWVSLGGPTLLVVGVSLGLATVTLIIGRMQAAIQRQEVEGRTKEYGYLVELIRGIATLKSAGAEELGVRRWMGHLTAWMGLSLQRQRLGIWSEVGLEGVRQGTSAALLIWGGKLVLDGGLKVGSLMAFLQMASGFLGAVLGLAHAYLGLELLRPQLARVDAILEVDPEPLPPVQVPATLGPVVLEDVWFRYGEDLPWVLKGYNLRVEPGEKCWLKAPSGFGKSTLLRLMAGLYTPQRGNLTIGGLKPSEVRSRLVYLPQFVQLYGGSVMDNLKLFSGGIPRSKIVEASEASGLASVVEGWPMGYETILSQGGGSFSGGQRQLVALTAVMASDRPLLLLDEAMANLDWLRRSWISDSPWFEGRTLIYASHDAGLGVEEIFEASGK